MILEQTMLHLQKVISLCDRCPRLRSVTPIPLDHICFSTNPTIMTIGRNPGLEYEYSHIVPEKLSEFYHEKWLISRYGKYLLNIFGIDFVKEHIFACNICKCSSPNNSALEQEEIDNCLDFLYAQIAIVDPKVILVFGSDASKALNLNVTYLKPFKFRNVTTLVCRHPAYFLRSHSETSDIHKEEQLKSLKSVKQFILEKGAK